MGLGSGAASTGGIAAPVRGGAMGLGAGAEIGAGAVPGAVPGAAGVGNGCVG
ncbi:hypothetical protein BIFGAL_04251 [Bifidobacterium gallicum DSM 20093 = LMG 11596]|uniref:Uncharacterized protein n=1 Tax=Bifidobacterium gallicum DSM 20093 = LMG 11596 TaxID=561180 RepID=D1NWJ8_9BIFI|nr:hypothetical protein BIFGAL_04251 [Bifidobacterium gallicum DSM 20093 = LMG 11596]